MTKRTLSIVISVFLMIFTLTSCINMSEEQIDRQAERISHQKVDYFHATQTEEFRTTLTPQPTPKVTAVTGSSKPSGNISENQKITISGYNFYDLDPIYSFGTDLKITYSAFVGLTRIDAETNEIGSGMASSWKISNDGLKWTFNLRESVPWVRYNPDTGGGRTSD